MDIEILLCDDDPVFLRWLSGAVAAATEHLGISAHIQAFSCGQEIPAERLAGCDIAFLDIDFPRQSDNGIDIARRLRRCGGDGVILFVTNYVEYAPEGYEVQAFRYLLKREASQKLEDYLRLALEQLRARRRTYPIQSGGETIHLPIEDILYIESLRHTAIAHVRRESGVAQYRFYASLRSVEEELAPSGFLRVQKSYLVNMRHIQKFQCKEVMLTSNILLPVSEKHYAQQKRQYLLWKGRQ